ncbi:MBL fold metallo-hydrolase [Virgibacillus phasianinus]|uniref:MBL fold metallo-hydrolase n=1 Tax=Virgibacillus phasianinus TaxID=2017483 RepID=A0A220TXS1_9BACI|nr:MBL fold metallo-hydrolase [Virgibacillus phasianinus]ASK60784.1 MBL fold metallo-hydrolase [Virgibacillus phasianinus]
MKFTPLNETCYYFDAVVNIGYVHHGDQGMLIDAGIDDSIMRKVLKELKANELPITHLFITHAHADHYGGAHFLQKKHDITTIAGKFESAILQHPTIEPLYLFQGNDPLPELHNKFLEGKPIQVDRVIGEGEHTIDGFTFTAHLLPGHSYHQLAMQIDNILFAGDSYFSEAQLEKHKIPYITDADLTLESLLRLLSIDCDGAVPGHGTFEKDFNQTVEKNIACHEEIMGWLVKYITNAKAGVTHETMVSDMCAHFAVENSMLSSWLLYRTAVTAYAVGLIKRGKIDHYMERNIWKFRNIQSQPN